MEKENKDRNLKYNRNEKRVSDNYLNKEDTTQYGESIPTNFAWVSPEKQKAKAKEIENITKKKGNK